MTTLNGKRDIFTNVTTYEQSDFSDNSPLTLGIDIGSISCKLALLDGEKIIRFLRYQRTHGRPLQTALGMLSELFEIVPQGRIRKAVGTGTAGRTLCELLGIPFINELICQSSAINHLYPQVRTLIEMGGQDSKILFLSEGDNQDQSKDSGDMVDFTMNTNCAAGTGSFLDQQATRLGVEIEEEFGELALKCEAPPRVAGRCSVFAKSDMIHLQQQATPVHDIVAGLCFGLARNLKSSLCQGKKIIKPVAFCGGVASNAGVVRAIREVFNLDNSELIVPDEHAVTGAIGAVIAQQRQGSETEAAIDPQTALEKLEKYLHQNRTIGHRLEPLKEPSHPAPASKVHQDILDKARQNGTKIKAYLGIDVGSISTNVVVMDAEKRVLSKAYLMTASRPLEAVRKGLDMVGEKVKKVVEICGVATTGSGRYLTGDFVGGDLVINEITAQATGAAIVDPTVDTIFEIGGQDSKYISLEEGVVVDFEMNHACAAGTGSFLEEQAERLGLSIKQEFAAEGFSSQAPIRLGERCTVFMESDLISYQQQGSERRDLVAGLSYSIVTNYINRVVGHRKIGQRIFFQGGTAFNRAVVSAFEMVTGKNIVVPDHHEVTGALGAAELARRHMQQLADQNGDEMPVSHFRGFDLSQLEYSIRSFECEKCSNNCEIKEVIIPGSEPLYYGSRCDIYNVKKDEGQTSDIPDLFTQRQRALESYARLDKDSLAKKKDRDFRGRVGLPMCLGNYHLLPLWGTFLDELGFETVLSGRSTKKVIRQGVEAVLSEICFPVKVAHGHVLDMLDKDVDYIWMPSVVSMNNDYAENKHNQLCPYVQTIPYQVRAALKAKGIDLTGKKNHLIDLHVRFQDGMNVLKDTLAPLAKKWGISKSEINRALDVALNAQRAFDQHLIDMGRETLDNLTPDQKACVIVSRPYNGCDPGVSLDLPRKLRHMNVLAIPMDFLDLQQAPISEPELQKDMYWKYGQRILRAAHIIREDPRLNAIYLSNFSCGPDSFIITLFKELMTKTDALGNETRKPALVLEIDEHSADAGVVTRLEAFHESLKAVESRRKKQEELAVYQRESNPYSPWKSSWGDCSERKMYIPWMGDCAYGLAAAFRHCGQPAEVLPIGDEETLKWGRQYTSGKECLPCIITTGDMLKKINQPGFEPDKTAFFMPASSGPCRFGQYNCLQRLILKQVGHNGDVPIVAPNQDSSFYQAFKRFRKDPTRQAFYGIAATDILYKALLKARPYEVSPGTADETYQRCLDRVCETIEASEDLQSLINTMEACAADWEKLPMDRSVRRPIVNVVGEIYVRNHTFANQDLVRQLEELGAEVCLPGFDEWLFYTNIVRKLMAKRWRNPKLYLQNAIKDFFQHRIEQKIAKPMERIFGPLHEKNIEHVLDLARPYVHESFEGEAVLTIGKILEMYQEGAAGAVSVGPFTCMPSNVVASVSREMSLKCNGMPILTISYDGQQNPTLQTRLEAFMHQVRNFDQRRQEAPVEVH